MTGLKHFSTFLSAARIDHPALAERPPELRLLALDFLGYLRGLRAQTGPNRDRPLSDSYLVHVMGDVEQFYAFMADHRHEAASKLSDDRWRHLGDEHARLWRIGDKPVKPRTPPDGAWLDDTAMSQIMANVQVLADPPAQGGLGDEQAMRLLMLLALTGRRVSELCLLEFDCLLPLGHLPTASDDEDGAVAKLRYQQTKIAGAPDTILVDRDVVALVHAQRRGRWSFLGERADYRRRGRATCSSRRSSAATPSAPTRSAPSRRSSPLQSARVAVRRQPRTARARQRDPSVPPHQGHQLLNASVPIHVVCSSAISGTCRRR